MIRFGRIHPDLDAPLMFSETEWQAAYILAKKPVFDKSPGVKTFRLGWQRVRDFVEGMDYVRKHHGGRFGNGMHLNVDRVAVPFLKLTHR